MRNDLSIASKCSIVYALSTQYWEKKVFQEKLINGKIKSIFVTGADFKMNAQWNLDWKLVNQLFSRLWHMDDLIHA